MMKNLFFVASIALFMLAACTNENELLNDNTIDQKKLYPHSVVTIDGKEVPYLTFSDYDSVGVGDTICNFSAITVDESMYPANLRSASDDNYNGLNELIDFPINIIVRESNSSARYLTNQGLNAELYLANYDANNNVKQTFYLMKSLNTFAPFYIETPVHIGILPNYFQRKPISVGSYTNNPGVKVVFVGDGQAVTSPSGLPMPTIAPWSISPSQRAVTGDGAYIFTWSLGSFGLAGCNMQSEGTKIRMGDYTSKGTQEFIIRPIEEFNMTSLELIVDNFSYAVRQPDFVDIWEYNNNTDTELEMSSSFTRKATLTSSFSREHSVSLSINTSMTVGGAGIIGGNISTTANDAHKWTYGQTESTEDTRTYNFPLKILKRTKLRATLFVGQYEMNLKYRAQFQGKTTGRIFTEIGNWKGIDCTEIRVDAQVTDASGNTSTQTFYGVPTSRVVFGNGNNQSSPKTPTNPHLQVDDPPGGALLP